MRSSQSTPSRPTDRGIPLLLLLAGEDHPKACTGRRLVRRGAARAVSRIDAAGRRPVVLDPYADLPLTGQDRPFADRGGLLAVDCSWNRAASRGALPRGEEGRAGIRRRLPILVAANPQHYGRVNELNTVEALSAALYLLGEPERAARLLDGFRGGPVFLELNRERLDQYRTAIDGVQVRAIERKLFGD